MRKSKQSLIDVAIARPVIPIPMPFTNAKPSKMWTVVEMPIATIGKKVILRHDSHRLFRSKRPLNKIDGSWYLIYSAASLATSGSWPMAR